MTFPKNFLWGASSAAYQVEGAVSDDGRGVSIWDTYSHDRRVDPLTGRTNILHLDTGDVACDHYHRYEEDVALMKQMGLKAYRFSLSWSRILPEGQGRVNPEGIAFYNRLIDALLGAGIEPFITLFHWDLPQALQDRGGWANPDMPQIFADYAKVVIDAFSDRVTYWMTLNEAQCHIIIGHLDGNCAPKLRVTPRQGFRLMHSIMLAHGLAVKTIRSHAVKKPMVGIASNPSSFFPESDKKEDMEAARKLAFSAGSKSFWSSTWWLDPIFLGKYPEDGIKAFGEEFPEEINNTEDLAIMKQPLDFLGCNLYTGTEVRAGKDGEPEEVPPEPGFPRSAMKWRMTPEILRYMPLFLYERYGVPIYITENGLSMCDWVSLDGQVHDPQRIDFLHRYLRELAKSIQDGAAVSGYLTWSVMDNYEWSEGYGERFGLIHIDYETQKRTLKDSALWYREVIIDNGELL